ncbi:MAG: hypothetical protein ACOCXZ_00425 [Chloroflexota bacterium]
MYFRITRRFLHHLFRFVPLAIISLLLAANPATAQDPDWSIYLYDNATQELVSVDAGGSQNTLPLEIPENRFVGGYDLEFSNDGTRAAYCRPVDEGSAGPGGSPSQLNVVDLTNGETLAAVDIDANVGCRATELDSVTGEVAVGVVYEYSGGETGADTILWALIIVDPTTGDILHSLDNTDSVAGMDDYLAENPLMMDVQLIDAGQVSFHALMWGTEGQAAPPAYTWNPEANTLETTPELSRASFETLPDTGEAVWLELDETLSAAETGSPVAPLNVVKYQTPGSEPETIYYTADWVLLDVQFADNGQAILVQMLEGATMTTDPGMVTSSVTRWVRLNRDGTVEEVAQVDGFSQAAPAPDGFVLLQTLNVSEADQPTRTELFYYRDDTRETLWSIEQDDNRAVTWSIAWQPPLTAEDDLPPFPAFG